MKIWISRHGQTDLNLEHRWQGRVNQPLNETGRRQAREMRTIIGDITFDAVYASPLSRAVETASIIGSVPKGQIIQDDLLLEADYGKYDTTKYMAPASLPLSLFWALPEVIPAPKTTEPIRSLIARSRAFLGKLEQENYDNVLVTCHGGIMRALTGCLTDQKNGIVWRPKPRNCEIRVFESEGGRHHMIQNYRLP